MMNIFLISTRCEEHLIQACCVIDVSGGMAGEGIYEKKRSASCLSGSDLLATRRTAVSPLSSTDDRTRTLN